MPERVAMPPALLGPGQSTWAMLGARVRRDGGATCPAEESRSGSTADGKPRQKRECRAGSEVHSFLGKNPGYLYYQLYSLTLSI